MVCSIILKSPLINARSLPIQETSLKFLETNLGSQQDYFQNYQNLSQKSPINLDEKNLKNQEKSLQQKQRHVASQQGEIPVKRLLTERDELLKGVHGKGFASEQGQQIDQKKSPIELNGKLVKRTK